jgi:hypothetical protein
MRNDTLYNHTQRNDMYHNHTEHNDSQHLDTQHNDTQRNNILHIALSIITANIPIRIKQEDRT